jgi:hypothetical protein
MRRYTTNEVKSLLGQNNIFADTAGGAYTGMPQKTTNNYDQISTFVTARLVYVDAQIEAL